QAEDGIRAFHVTGVQTCALPISPSHSEPSAILARAVDVLAAPAAGLWMAGVAADIRAVMPASDALARVAGGRGDPGGAAFEFDEIGRASCRERVGIRGDGRLIIG